MSEKIKFFHELTKEEFDELKKIKMTWFEFEKKYPRPNWCAYPEAVRGFTGCWSLMGFRVSDKKSCGGCDCVIGSKNYNLEQEIQKLQLLKEPR